MSKLKLVIILSLIRVFGDSQTDKLSFKNPNLLNFKYHYNKTIIE